MGGDESQMIGYVYVRDIPKLIVGIMVSLIVFVAVFSVLWNIPGFMDLFRSLSEWVGTCVFLLLLGGSMWAGLWCGEAFDHHFPPTQPPEQLRQVIDSNFPVQQQREPVEEVNDPSRKARTLTADERNAIYRELEEKRMEALRKARKKAR
jgi:hypothetical protein